MVNFKKYIEPDVLLKDDRFKINSDFFTSLCDNSFILEYKIKNIKLKDIKRYRNKRIYKINEVHPYLYLKGKIDESEYCREEKS